MVKMAETNCSGHKLYDSRIDPGMTWLICSDCEHVYTDGYFGADINDILFATAHKEQLPGWEPELGRSIAGRIVERIATVSRPPGQWLDVGFGDGNLLLTAQEFGYEPIGLDLRSKAVEGLTALGVEAHSHTLSVHADIHPRPSYSVISLADVLEHDPYPVRMLNAARALISSDGALFVSCPNLACAPWAMMTKLNANPYWSEIEHFHNFTRARLTKLLEQCGFAVVRYGISERYRMGMELIARPM